MIDPAQTDVLVLAGGFGTRLRAVVSDRPKPLAEIHNRPFLHYILQQVRVAGFRRAILCTGDRAQQVEDRLRDDSKGVELVFSAEKTPLGTGGALGLAAPLVRSSHALVLNGDSYVDSDFRAYCDWYGKAGFGVGVLGVRVPDAARYGTLAIADEGRITAFTEKTGLEQPGWINGGVYLIERARLAAIPCDRPVSLETDVFPGWVADGAMGAYQVHDRFIDIGTPESYAAATAFFAAAS